jgi:AraC-like DNA-binding protein
MTPIDRQSGGAAAIVLSSDALDPRDRFDAWREELMLRVMRVDVSVPDRLSFRTRLRILSLPNLGIIERRTTPSLVKRTTELVRDGDDSLVFSFPWRGTVEAGVRRARVGPGEAVVTSLHEVNISGASDGFHGVSIRMGRDTARRVLPTFDEHLNRATPLDPAASALLRAYLMSLIAHRGVLSHPVVALADMQVRELLAHVFDPEGDLARAGVYGGVKAARLRAVVEEIAARLADPGLSAATVGRRLGLSERYVQQLLEGAGLSFSTFVRVSRLKRARRLLRDPLSSHLRIVDIAMMTGFGDLSHFNRAFRLQFGETPTDARRAR